MSQDTDLCEPIRMVSLYGIEALFPEIASI